MLCKAISRIPATQKNLFLNNFTKTEIYLASTYFQTVNFSKSNIFSKSTNKDPLSGLQFEETIRWNLKSPKEIEAALLKKVEEEQASLTSNAFVEWKEKLEESGFTYKRDDKQGLAIFEKQRGDMNVEILFQIFESPPDQQKLLDRTTQTYDLPKYFEGLDEDIPEDGKNGLSDALEDFPFDEEEFDKKVQNEDEGEETDEDNRKDKPFIVKFIKRGETVITFFCVASRGGEFWTYKVMKGGPEGTYDTSKSTYFTLFSEELQELMFEYFECFGIDEKVSYLVYEYFEATKIQTQKELLETLKQLVS